MTLLLLLSMVVGLDVDYRAGKYEEVVRNAPQALAQAESRADSADVLQLQASALVALGRDQEAAVVFGRLLDLVPETELDPKQVSPKIRAVFDQVRAARPAPVVKAKVDTARTRERVASEARASEARMPLSALVPGLNQVRNDRRAKGYLLLGGAALSVVGLAGSHVMYQRTHDAYLNSTDLNEIQSRYDDANRWHQARTIFIGTTSIVWLYSLVDALLQL